MKKITLFIAISLFVSSVFAQFQINGFGDRFGETTVGGFLI